MPVGARRIPTIFGSKPSIGFPASSVLDSATVGVAVGTASIRGRTTGTASWSLTNSAGGKYAINSSTGAVTVAASLTAGSDLITIAVSGLTPAVASKSFSITVTASAGVLLWGSPSQMLWGSPDRMLWAAVWLLALSAWNDSAQWLDAATWMD